MQAAPEGVLRCTTFTSSLDTDEKWFSERKSKYMHTLYIHIYIGKYILINAPDY